MRRRIGSGPTGSDGSPHGECHTESTGSTSGESCPIRRYGLPTLCVILFLALTRCTLSDPPATPAPTVAGLHKLVLPGGINGPVTVTINSKGEIIPPAPLNTAPPVDEALAAAALSARRAGAAKALALLDLKVRLATCPLDIESYKGTPAMSPDYITKNGSIRVASLKSDRRLKMAVYARSKLNPSVDVVSDQLVTIGEFEGKLVNVIHSAFESMSKNVSRFNQSDFLFIDIGSNVGIYSMVMSNLGVSTFAVDALRNNVALLDYSARCLNPYLTRLNRDENVTFRVVQSALASPAQLKDGKAAAQKRGKLASAAECALVSEYDNLGDGMLICDEAKISELLKHKYVVRDRMKLQLLDDVFAANQVYLRKGTIVKMDIEGQEWHAIQGAMESLFSPSPPRDPKRRRNTQHTHDGASGGSSEVESYDPKEYRPKLVLAEIWRKFFDTTEAEKYADYMMNTLGYVCAIEATTVGSNLDPVWCSHAARDSVTGERVPCVMTTPKQFSSWLFKFVKVTEMKNLLWVQPEWGPVMTPWAFPPRLGGIVSAGGALINPKRPSGNAAPEDGGLPPITNEDQGRQAEMLNRQKELMAKLAAGGGLAGGAEEHQNQEHHFEGNNLAARDPRNAQKEALVRENVKKQIEREAALQEEK